MSFDHSACTTVNKKYCVVVCWQKLVSWYKRVKTRVSVVVSVSGFGRPVRRRPGHRRSPPTSVSVLLSESVAVTVQA